MTDANGDSTSGRGTIISFVITAIGLAAAKWPHLANIVFLSQHSVEVTQLLGYGLAGLGWIGTNISHPPAAISGPVSDLKFWAKSFFRRKPIP